MAALWDRVGQAAQAPSLQWLAAAGLVLLAVCYLILTRTRLARIHVVWKCVILSIVAHAILICLAFGTHLIFDYGHSVGGEPLVIRLIDDLEAEDLEDVSLPEPSTLPPDTTNDSLAEPETTLDLPMEFSESAQQGAESASPPATVDPFGDLAPPLLAPPQDVWKADTSFAEPQVSPATDSLPDVPPNSTDPELSVAEDQHQTRSEPPADTLPVADNHQESHDTPPATNETEASDGPPLVAVQPPAPPEHEAREAVHSETSPVVLQPVQFRRATVRRSGDEQPLPSRFLLRTPEARRRAAMEHGGSEATESAVDLALRWLSTHQEPDGRWSVIKTGGGIDRREMGHERPGCGRQADTGISGLALLAFLGAGHSHLEGDYRGTVARGLEFLVRSQATDGCLGGDAQLYDRMYCHGIALLALSDALAFTGDPRLRDAVERGVQYTVRAQSSLDGGWRYRPGDAGDMSQFGWQVMSLHCAGLAGIPTPDRTLTGMHRFLGRCTRGQFGGLGCYRPGEGHTPSMTAEALVSRFMLESTSIQRGAVDEATGLLRRHLPNANEFNYYYWYYGTMAMHMVGGDTWRQWNDALVTALLSRQIITGDAAGSWPADGLWSGYGGTVYSTALAALCLECYYRLHFPEFDK